MIDNMNLICYNIYCIECNIIKSEKRHANSAGIKITANLYNSSNSVRFSPYIAALGVAVDENIDV